jgi:hypothetical protein
MAQVTDPTSQVEPVQAESNRIDEEENADPQSVSKDDSGTDVEGAFPQTADASLSGDELDAYILRQFAELDNPSYRARARARVGLEQYPLEVVSHIARVAPYASLNTTQQLIDLLDYFATRPDVAVSALAFDTLQTLASKEGTALASIAKRSMTAIEDAKEHQATLILSAAGALIGRFPIAINGSQSSMYAPEPALQISSESFVGGEDTYQWMRFLRSVNVVSLEGPGVSQKLIEAVAEMPNARKILLNRCELTPAGLRALRKLPKIEHLELRYVPVGDEVVGVICELPLSESLRLFGTNITATGEKQIAQQLDGIEIYRGRGGFLGIKSSPTGPVVVTGVEPKSGAAEAGVMEFDQIIEINGVVIKNFQELRGEIANYTANESIMVKLLRARQGKLVELSLTVVLGAQP